MQVIGIISVHEKKAYTIDRILNRIKIKEQFGTNPEYMVAELPYSSSDISNMSIRRQKKLFFKARRILYDFGADAVLPSAECKILEAYGTEYAQSFKIPPSRIFECFMFCRKKLKNNEFIKELHIFDNELAAFNHDKLSSLCTLAKRIVLYTDKTTEADKLAQKLFAEYGIFIKILSRSSARSDKTPYSIIDADYGIVRIGDFRIDGAEFVSNSGRYNLNAAHEAAILGDSISFEIRNWLSGKNVIKKVDNND